MSQSTMDDKSLEDFNITVLEPGSQAYDEARKLWNGMVDRNPQLILQPGDVEGVAKAVRFARAHKLPIAVKAGGHSAAGHSMCGADGIVIDLCRLNAVTVNPKAKRATVQGGALLRDLDEATAPHGLVVPVGTISHTGVGGLILGGGFSNIMRKFGLSIDSLLSVQMVLADGTIVETSATEHPDLFWAVRGGGGNFGIATDFRFRCHNFGPDVFVATCVIELEHAELALKVWGSVMKHDDAPDELTWISRFRGAPKGTGFGWVPERLRGKPVLLMPFFWAGDTAEGERVVTALVKLLPVAASVCGVAPWVTCQQQMDEIFPPGRRSYSKAGFLSHLPDALVKQLVDCAASMPHPACQFEILRLGGAVSRTGLNETAFPHRQARWPIDVMGLWDAAADDVVGKSWVHSVYKVSQPYLSGGSYGNHAGGDEEGGTSAVYGRSWERLTELKKKFDPDNVFRFNFNLVR